LGINWQGSLGQDSNKIMLKIRMGAGKRKRIITISIDYPKEEVTLLQME